ANTAAGGGAVGSTPMIGTPFSASLTHLFTTTEGAFTVRGFTEQTSSPAATSPTTASGGTIVCIPTPRSEPGFEAEVSSQEMVGSVALSPNLGVSTSSNPIIAAHSASVGIAEAGPAMVVDTDTSSAVAQLRMTFAWGTVVTQTPVKGYAALVAAIPSTDISSNSFSATTVGTLAAVNSAGTVLQTASLDLGTYPAPATPSTPGTIVFNPPVPVPNSGTASSGSGLICHSLPCGPVVSSPAGGNSPASTSPATVCPLVKSTTSTTSKG
ncbi:MAG: hypothetical protein ACRDYC_00115, partial [Acidimicrobiales bacterium]